MVGRAGDVGARFWSKVTKTDGCWLWTGGVDRGGRGRFNLRGENLAAAKVAYELTVGPVPDGGVVAHACGNRVCVRPDHVVITTKGVMARRNGTPRFLTDEQEREAVRLYVVLARSTEEIAAPLGCSPSLIHKTLVKHGAPLRPEGFRRPGLSRHSGGYLKWDGEYVHRIVAEAWYGPIPDGHQVHHKDEDKTNNHPDNLEIVAPTYHHTRHSVERSAWTAKRDAFLIECSRREIPSRVVAEVLGTTTHAVSNRRRVLREWRATGTAKAGRRWTGRDTLGEAKTLWADYQAGMEAE